MGRRSNLFQKRSFKRHTELLQTEPCEKKEEPKVRRTSGTQVCRGRKSGEYAEAKAIATRAMGYVRQYALLKLYSIENTEVINMHTECYASIHANVWSALCSGSPVWLKRARILKDNAGLPEPGLREVAFSAPFADSCAAQHIMPIREAFIESGEPEYRVSSLYAVFPHVEHDLVSYLTAHPAQPEPVKNIMRQLLEALDQLHSRGIVHRNLKSQTIFLTNDGKLMLGGMSTAQMVCPSYHYDPPSSWMCTTISARSPELLLGSGRWGPAQDIWAAGMIFATMCKCKRFSKLGFLGHREFERFGRSTREASRGFLEAIFGRLCMPERGHPLTTLGGWIDFTRDPISVERLSGWSDAEPLAGGKGVQLLTHLTHLDACCRPSAKEALAAPYFDQDERVGPASSNESEMADQQSRNSGEVDQTYPPEADVCRVCTGSGSFFDDKCPLCEGDRDFCKSVRGDRCAGEASYKDVPWVCVKSRAADLYISEEVAKKNVDRAVARTALQAIVLGFRRCGRSPCHLVRSVWSFICRERSPLVDCLAHTADINARMRGILLDWITEVTAKYKLHEPVVYYTADLVDAYLLRHPALHRKRFQLLGATAMMLAEKIAGDESVEIHDMVYICDKQYVDEDVIHMEESLLEVVRDVWPRWSGYHYLSYFAEQMSFPKMWFHTAQMFLERSLLNYPLTRHPKSLTAASACLLAMDAASKQPDPETLWLPDLDPCAELALLCKQSASVVRSVADEISQGLSSASLGQLKNQVLKGAREKFKSERFSKVSTMSGVVWSDE